MSESPQQTAKPKHTVSLDSRLVFSASEAADLLATSRDTIRHAMDQAAQSGGQHGLRWFMKPGSARRSVSRKALEDYIAALERQAMGA